VRAKATTEDHIGQFKLYIELPLVDSAGNKDTIAYYRRSGMLDSPCLTFDRACPRSGKKRVECPRNAQS